MTTVSVPGKMMLLGDYAVLERGRAMVAAVNRRAVGTLTESTEEPSKVVAAVLAQAGQSPAGAVTIDTGGFYEGALKLGLGSSAAVAVATAALALNSGDERVLETAIAGHRAANDGLGSGVDVAACYHGGVIATTRQPAQVLPLPSRLGKLELFVLFTGKSASTSELVRAARHCAKWAQWSPVLKRLAEEGCAAYQKGEADRFLAIVAQYGRAMAGLGHDAGVPIVTEEIDALMRHAAELGGAAKPSGAGGGDIVIAWGSAPEMGEQLAERTGAQLIDLRIDPRGLDRKAAL